MSLFEREAAAFFHTYKRLPLQIVRGEGMYLSTAKGDRYLDMFAGIAVNALGHAHPRVVKAIADQAARYIHVSNYFAQEPQIRLAELLIRFTGAQRVFFCNSGTEATEGALKIARRWGSARGKSRIVGFTNSFHGRTMGALSLMDRASYREGFGPFLDGCTTLPFNDVDALHNGVGPDTAAVIFECIQGEGGIRPLSADVAEALRQLRNRYGFLLIADEIQTGCGRTGQFLASGHFGLAPDLITLAKPLGGGLPLGAILGAASVADVLQPGMHGTTFGGNPVACAAGIAVLEEFEEHDVMQNVATMGSLFLSLLRACAQDFPLLCKEVRGIGLMIGLELIGEAEPVVIAMRERGILINGTDKSVLRFVPPLIVQEHEIRRTVDTLREVFSTVSSF